MQLTLHCEHCNHTMLIDKPSFEEEIYCESCNEYIKTFSAYIEKNTIVNEQFQIKYPVCEDNCSQTFIAFDINSESLCLIRIYDPELSECLTDLNNFIHVLNSASLLAGRSHLRVGDHGIDDKHIYQIFPYIELESLGDIVDQNRELDPMETIDLCRELLLSLDEASIATGTGHFNLTPSNIFVDSQGNVRYTDFGLASQLIRDNKFLQSQYHVLNLHYMSPEMALAWSQPSPSSDIYSIGCIIFFCLTGMDPFAGIDSPEKIDYGNLLLPRRVEFDLDPEFINIFQRMTTINPAQRYTSYREAVDAIERYRNSIGTTTKIGKPRGHRTQIYDSMEFHNLETTHHLKRTSSNTSQQPAVNRDQIKAQMATQASIALPSDFAKKMSSRNTTKRPRAKRSGKNTAQHKRPARRGNSSASPGAAKRGHTSASPGGRRSGGATMQHKRAQSPATKQHKRPPARKASSSSSGNGMLVGTLVVILILVVIGAVYLLGQQEQELANVKENKIKEAHAKPIGENQDSPTSSDKVKKITTPLPPEYAEHLAWLQSELLKDEVDNSEFSERLLKARILAEGRPLSTAALDKLDTQFKEAQESKKRLISNKLKATLQDLVYNKKFDEAIAICEDEEAPNAAETLGLRKALLLKIKEQQALAMKEAEATASAQEAELSQVREELIKQLAQAVALVNEIRTTTILEDISDQLNDDKIKASELTSLIEKISQESRLELVAQNLANSIGAETTFFHEDNQYSGTISSVNTDEQSFKLKFIYNGKTIERDFALQQLPSKLWQEMLKTDSESDSAFIQAWYLNENKQMAAAYQALKNYSGPYAEEFQNALASRVNELALTELSEISDNFGLKDADPVDFNISEANAQAAHFLLSNCLKMYAGTDAVKQSKEKIEPLLTLLESRSPQSTKPIFVSPKPNAVTTSLKAALSNPKNTNLALLPGSYHGVHQISTKDIEITGCNGVVITGDLHISGTGTKIKNLEIEDSEVLITTKTTKILIENCLFTSKGITLSGDNSDIKINNSIINGLNVTDSKRIEISNSTLLESPGTGNASSRFCIYGPFNGKISNSIVYANEGYALSYKEEAKVNFDFSYSLLYAQRGHIIFNDKKLSVSDLKEVKKHLGRWSNSLLEKPEFLSYGSDFRLKDFTPGFTTGLNKINMGAQLNEQAQFIDIAP